MFGPLAATGLLLAAPGCDLDLIDDDDDGDTPETAPQDEAGLELPEALDIAREQFPDATVIDAYLTDAAHWVIELYDDGTEFEVHVSRTDGSILEFDQDSLDAEDAIEASAAATLVRSSPGWLALIDTAELTAGGSATEVDVDAEEGILEVYVEATATWVVEFDADGHVLDVDRD